MSLSGYSYYRSVTIDHTKCGSSDSTNFPVLFSGTYTYLKTVGNGGSVQNSSGYDIVFSTDQVNVLNFDLENYNAVTGEIEAWVNIGTVSHTSDTVLYVYYGNASISTFQGNTNSTWNSNYKAVYHLADNAATTNVVDSTADAYTGTNQANTSTKTAAGEIASGLTYNGSSDYTQVAYQANLNTANFTVSAWVKISGGQGAFRAIASSRDSSNGSANKGWILYADSSNKFSGWIGVNTATFGKAISTTTITTGTWYFVVFTYDGTNARMYVNGSLQATTATSYTQNTTFNMRIGAGANETTATFFFNGVEDEVRISNTARGADWITTEYNNQSSPSTFYTVGSQQNNSVSATKSVGARFLQAIAHTQSVGARLRQAVAHTQSVASRLRLAVNHAQSVNTRFLQAVNHTQSVTSRFRQAIGHTQSVGARLLLSIARSKSVGARLRQAALRTQSVQGRLRQAVNASKSEQVRLRQAIAHTQNTRTRLRQAVPHTRSTGVRFRRGNNATRYTAIRLLLATQHVLSVGARLRQASGRTKSTPVRFILASVSGQARTKSLGCRFVLASRIPTVHVTWVTRDMQATWTTRDMTIEWRTRD